MDNTYRKFVMKTRITRRSKKFMLSSKCKVWHLSKMMSMHLFAVEQGQMILAFAASELLCLRKGNRDENPLFATTINASKVQNVLIVSIVSDRYLPTVIILYVKIAVGNWMRIVLRGVTVN